MLSITLLINSGIIFPALRRIIRLSAVKIRSGRINESTGNEPDTKSFDVNACTNESFDGWDVIWQSKMSSPRRLDKTKAGRLLDPDKSEKGKRMTTTSPFTNLSTRCLLQGLTNLLPKHVRLHNGFPFCRFFLNFQKPCRPIYEPLLLTNEHYFSIDCVSPMFAL